MKPFRSVLCVSSCSNPICVHLRPSAVHFFFFCFLHSRFPPFLPARTSRAKAILVSLFESNQLTGQWDIPLRDLDSMVPLGLDKNGFVTWENLNRRFPDVAKYAFSHLKISVDGQAAVPRMTSSEPVIEDFSDGAYVQLAFAVTNILAHPKGFNSIIGFSSRRTRFIADSCGWKRTAKRKAPSSRLNIRRSNSSLAHQPRGENFARFCAKESGTSGPGTITSCSCLRSCCLRCCNAKPDIGVAWTRCVRHLSTCSRSSPLSPSRIRSRSALRRWASSSCPRA